MNFSSDGVAVAGALMFGAGSGTILLDEVKCNGAEVSIINCRHYGWRNHDCYHDEDIGVICGKRYIIFNVSKIRHLFMLARICTRVVRKI